MRKQIPLLLYLLVLTGPQRTLAQDFLAPCETWNQITNAGSPGARQGHAMAFDTDRGVTVLFGGMQSTSGSGDVYLNDTWEYDGKAWRRVPVVGPVPPARQGHGMVYDSARHQGVLFGGDDLNTIYADAWVYTNSGGNGVWTRIADFNGTGRTGQGAAFDTRRGVTVAVGGMSDYAQDFLGYFTNITTDVFEWDGTHWSAGVARDISTQVLDFSTSEVAFPGTAFDSDRGVVVTVGGMRRPVHQFVTPPFEEDFVTSYDGKAWNLNFSGYSDVGFSHLAMAFDTARNHLVRFGGRSIGFQYDKDNYLNQRCIGFTTDDSVRLAHVGPSPLVCPPDQQLPGLPLGRCRHAMVFDSKRGVTVMFGGVRVAGGFELAGMTLDETWELSATTDASATILPPAQPPCPGATVTLGAAAGNGGYIQWRRQGVNLVESAHTSGTTTTTLTIAAVGPADEGDYDFVYRNECGVPSTSQKATLLLAASPANLKVTPSLLEICSGDDGALSAQVQSALAPAYQWFKDGQALAGETAATLAFHSANPSQSGYYTVSAANACGSITSAPVPVAVGVWFAKLPASNLVLTPCTTADIALLSYANAPVGAAWTLNGLPLPTSARVSATATPQADGGTVYSVHIDPVHYADEGVYQLTVGGPCGSQQSPAVTVQVLPNPAWAWAAVDGPSARADTAMAYDNDRQRTVLFGGDTGTGLVNDTWEFDGTTWTQRTPMHSPPALSLHSVAYDGKRKKTVLFGGQTYAGGGTYVASAQTWEWDGNDWGQAATPAAPDARMTPAMTFDSVHNVVLLFGGLRTNTPVHASDFWSYDGKDWTLIKPEGIAPLDYFRPLMAFDALRGVAVLFSARDTNGVGRVWEWDGSKKAFTALSTAGDHPIPPGSQSDGAMAYDAFRHQIVVFGGALYGFLNGSFTQSTGYVWRWDGNTWTADLPTPLVPSAGLGLPARHSMTFDSARNMLLVFGGRGTGPPLANYTHAIRYDEPAAFYTAPAIVATHPFAGTTVIQALAGGAPPVTYQWRYKGVNLANSAHIDGATTPTLTISNFGIADYGDYDVVASNGCGTVTAPSATLPEAFATTALHFLQFDSRFLKFPVDFVLQRAPAPDGPWTNVPNAQSGNPYGFIGPSNAGFYRAVFTP